MSQATSVTRKPKKVLTALHSGFCYGVKMAVDKAFDLADTSEKPVYVLGELIHNPQVVEKLKGKNVITVQSVDDIPKGSACLIRTHGVGPEHIDQATEKSVDVHDATCPDVKRVQDRAIELSQEGYTVVMVGKEDHPEVKGVLSHARRTGNTKIFAINSPEELVASLKHERKTKIGIVSQTTQKEDNFFDVVAEAAKLAQELKVFNTICPATFKRQSSAEELAHEVELMVVIGGRNSSNTTHLAEICRQEGTPAIHIETVKELTNCSELDKVDVIGVTAGASTPDWIIQEVIDYLEQWHTQEIT